MNLFGSPSSPPYFDQPDPGNGNGFPGDRDSSTLDTTMAITFFVFLAVSAVMVLLRVAIYVLRRRHRLSEDELMREEDNQAYLELGLEEQELYFQSKDFLLANPYLRGDLSLSQNLAIQERGIKAWEFVKDPMLTNNDLVIVNKTELNFLKDFECSVLTNLPMPAKNEVYYFECKMYHLPEDNVTVSIGLGAKPYPWFRLPGRHSYTVSYDSDGRRRHAQPFPFTDSNPPFPAFSEGDVIGVGYRVRSGTVFFTRNGKKVGELKIGGHIRNFRVPDHGHLYPIIGASNMCSVHVNLGQMGFVFIEGNVKKWGFAPLEGNGPAPPAYNKFNADILLERSEIDDSDISDREGDFPPDFWDANDNDQDKHSYNAYRDVDSGDERITMASMDGAEVDEEERQTELGAEEPERGTQSNQEIQVEALVPPMHPPSYSDRADSEHAAQQNADPESNPDILERSETSNSELPVQSEISPPEAPMQSDTSHPEAPDESLTNQATTNVSPHSSHLPDNSAQETELALQKGVQDHGETVVSANELAPGCEDEPSVDHKADHDTE